MSVFANARLPLGTVLELIIGFVIISFVIFIILRKFFNYKQKEPAAATTPEDILLLREIRDTLRGQGRI